MRAGCFAEDRVIDLINRRFVPFYFNRGGPGEGHDAVASKFVDKQTKNPYAWFAAFRPTGEIVGETELYADKDEVASWLLDLLRKYPEYAKPTEQEASTLAAVDSAKQRLEGARLAEEVGDYALATQRYEALAEADDAAAAVEARLGLLRIARHGKQWDVHGSHEKALRAMPGGESVAVHADVERGYRLVATKDYAAARALLQPLTKRAASTQRHAEAHFLAGVACWFTDDRDWAKLHWGWILEHLADDRLAMRARIAAAAEGMPYANAELSGFKADVGNIGTDNIVNAVRKAMGVYREMLPFYESGNFTAKRATASASSEFAVDSGSGGKAETAASPTLLVAQLRDGNEHVPPNNRVVKQLESIGVGSIAPLRSAIEDRAFPGRGYAAWALACVLRKAKSRDESAMATLEAARRDEDPYVAELARSGLSTIQ
ncbi:MAG: hypothetical protein ABIP94_03905 [Planctomycetota bacterium]